MGTGVYLVLVAQTRNSADEYELKGTLDRSCCTDDRVRVFDGFDRESVGQRVLYCKLSGWRSHCELLYIRRIIGNLWC